MDTATGEFTHKTFAAKGMRYERFTRRWQVPWVVRIEASGAMQWFLELLEEVEIECRVGHPAKIRAQETRKQKHDRRDARLLLQLLSEDRFPEIWLKRVEESEPHCWRGSL